MKMLRECVRFPVKNALGALNYAFIFTQYEGKKHVVL
jgi:hypothetical protein